MILKMILITGIILYFIIIINFIKKDKIYLKYALLWFLLGIILFIFALFPNFLAKIMNLFGIVDPLNGLFCFLFLFLFVFLICLLVTITRLNKNNKTLIQKVALLEKKINEVKENVEKK